MKNSSGNKMANISARYACFIGVFLISIIIPAYAQVVTVDQPLYFGKFAMANQPATSRITIRTNGLFTTNANTFMFDTPTRGEYTLTGAPANSTYTITTPASVDLTGPGGTLFLDRIRVRPNTLVTNGAGEDEFRISGRLRALAGNGPFSDGVYNSTFTITLNF